VPEVPGATVVVVEGAVEPAGTADERAGVAARDAALPDLELVDDAPPDEPVD